MDMTHTPRAFHGARYKLLYTFRAHLSDDNSYNCVYQKQDERGNSSDLSHGSRVTGFNVSASADVNPVKQFSVS